MMLVMRKSVPSSRSAAKADTHERIVSVAARAIRRSGYDGTGVADVMNEAGLTHGAFYTHFASREAMLAEAARQACAESAALAARAAAAVPRGQALKAMFEAYLSEAHLQGVERGCPLAALGAETARQSPEVRRVTTGYIKESVDLMARQFPDWGRPGAHDRALAAMATMVGALTLARAVDEPELARRLLDAALQQLTTATASPT
jgi:AcrR family transcriptional regulator